jgi:hypothetical protein
MAIQELNPALISTTPSVIVPFTCPLESIRRIKATKVIAMEIMKIILQYVEESS